MKSRAEKRADKLLEEPRMEEGDGAQRQEGGAAYHAPGPTAEDPYYGTLLEQISTGAALLDEKKLTIAQVKNTDK